MPFYTDAYLADTQHLTTEEHGAYLLLLLYSWRNNGALPPDDDRRLSRITRLSLRRWKQVVRPNLEMFFTISEEGWHQKRLQKTWADTQAKITIRSTRYMREKSRNSRKNNTSPSPIHKPDPLSDDVFLHHSRVGVSSSRESCNQIAHEIRPPQAVDATARVTNTSSATPALDALKPVLSDIRYFTPRGRKISPELAPQLCQAQKEITALLTPISPEDNDALVAKLMRVFPIYGAPQEKIARVQDYIDAFALYPADLLQHAMDDTIATHAFNTLPRIADIIQKITPALEQRRKQKDKIERLLKQVDS